MTVRAAAMAVAWLVAMASVLAMVWVSGRIEASATPGTGPAPFSVALAVLVVVTTTVGWLLVARRPGNRIGMLMAVGATVLTWAFIAFGVGGIRSEAHGQQDVIGGLATLIGQVVIVPALFMTFPAPMILFPDGRLPGPRWRWPFRVVVAAIAFGGVTTALVPWASVEGLADHPVALPLPAWLGEVAGGLSAIALIAALVMAAAAIFVRYRRSTGIERAQIKWLSAALVVAALLFPLSWATDLGPGQGAAVDVVSVVALALVPVAILVAILRYRLYEIDRLVSRSLSWALISGGLLAVFGGLVIALQGALAGVTQGQTVAVAISTLVAAALFQPIRRRVQHAVDRRFGRSRYDAERTAQAFARRLQHEIDLETLAAELRSTVGASVRPSASSIWLADRRATRRSRTASAGHDGP